MERILDTTTLRECGGPDYLTTSETPPVFFEFWKGILPPRVLNFVTRTDVEMYNHFWYRC